MMFYDSFRSPLGAITLATDRAHLTELHIEGDRYFHQIPRDWKHDPMQPVLQEAQRQLLEYFAGIRPGFELPVAATGTEFQRAVWMALETIPTGSTATYSEIAEAIGRPTAVRAVGTAVGRNPICIVVPCHRVLASNGGLGGYVAGLERKRKLLRLEGVAL